MFTKPPLGIDPESVWRRQRIRDLMAAIDRFLFVTPTNHGKLLEWSTEIKEHLLVLSSQENIQ